MKFHGEDQSFLGDTLLRFASTGIFAYSTFNIVAGGLGVHTDLKNLLVFATGAITIIQVKAVLNHGNVYEIVPLIKRVNNIS